MKAQNIVRLAFVGSLAASAAFAAPVYQDMEGGTYFNTTKGYISASTPLETVEFTDRRNDLVISTRCGVNGAQATSYTVKFMDDDGNLLGTSGTHLCDQTPRMVSFTGPQFAHGVQISPTTAVSTTAGGMSPTIIQTGR